jgi:nicotinamide-nucleotide amidase
MDQTDDVAALVARLGRELQEQDLSLAVAESCTGGLFASAIVADPDVSSALERGFIVYSTDAKCELLDLSRDRVESCEGVSTDIALGMARAALERSRGDVAVAITGFAGPRQGEEEVGLVHVAAVRAGKNPAERTYHFGDIGRSTVNDAAVRVALELLIEVTTAN